MSGTGPTTTPPTVGAPRRRGRAVVAVVGVLVVLLASLLLLRACGPQRSELRVIAAGDMACQPDDPRFGGGQGSGEWCRASEVSDLAVSLAPDAVLGLGDYQYEVPTAATYDDVYGPTWGRLREITYPALGNQEYKVNKANTFFAWFGDRAPNPDGYFSTDLAGWHVVVLNSNCTEVEGGCGPESPQLAWLREDLAATSTRCIAAVWHHPRWSTGIAGPDDRTEQFVTALVDAGADLVVSGHEADYERFGRLDAQGRPDPQGMAQFVSGVGGQIHYEPQTGDAPWRAKVTPPPSAFADFTHHGVLALTLREGGYDWSFHRLGGEVVDTGSDTCG